MAENTSYTVEYNFGDLVKEVAGLKTAVIIGSVVGTAAIAAGVGIAWFLIDTALETNKTLGELKGERSVVVILEDIQKTLKDLSVEKVAPKAEAVPEKQGSLENLPTQMGNWTGIKAETADKLADALTKTPPTKGPVVVYTEDADAAAALKSMLDAQ